MTLGTERKYTINSINRALRILFILGEDANPIGLSDLSRKLGIDRSTTYRILSTLREQGFVEQSPETRKYALGLRVIEVGSLKLRSIQLLPTAKPFLQDLMLQTKETVHLAVLVEGEMMYLDCEQCAGIFNVSTQVGGKAPLHSSAVGKALLAEFPGGEVDRVLAIRGLSRFTDHTLTNLQELRRHLAGAREQGYAFDDEETHLGVRCLAAAIYDHQGLPVATVGISGPALRITPERVPILAHMVKECAIKISRQLGYTAARPEFRVTVQESAHPADGHLSSRPGGG